MQTAILLQSQATRPRDVGCRSAAARSAEHQLCACANRQHACQVPIKIAADPIRSAFWLAPPAREFVDRGERDVSVLLGGWQLARLPSSGTIWDWPQHVWQEWFEMPAGRQGEQDPFFAKACAVFAQGDELRRCRLAFGIVELQALEPCGGSKTILLFAAPRCVRQCERQRQGRHRRWQ